MEKGKCQETFFAGNESVALSASNAELKCAIDDVLDICLILSFLTGACVTPTGTTQMSDIQFIALGDRFLPPRAIRGFPDLDIRMSLQDFFKDGLQKITADFADRRMRLFLAHWISGITCYTLEDLFLSIGVQMDIVKQCEIQKSQKKMKYFDGMISASRRYGLKPLNEDYKEMRNDIVHEGTLTGSHFKARAKIDCAQVTADALNWIDKYILSVLGIGSSQARERWKASDFEHGLPALSI